jgi:hypothetical protein
VLTDSGQDTQTTPDDGTPPADTSPPPPDTNPPPDTTPPPPAETYEMKIGDWTVKPGKEGTKCMVKRLDNETAIWVTQIRTVLAKGSHHLIVYHSDETEEQLTPFNCTPFTEAIGGESFPLIISQISEEALTLPPGVAFKFKPGQMIRLEAHFLNYYTDDITAHADVYFDTITEKDVTDEANMLFYGAPDLEIKAGQTVTTSWNFIDVWEGTKIFAITGHTHAYGTNVEIQTSTAKDINGTHIYPGDKPFEWDEAPIERFDPPLAFNSGDGLRYRCTWTNTGNNTVGFGESGSDEMCFLWAYYYPSKGYRMCVNPGQYGNLLPGIGDQVCCPDDALCELIKTYLKDFL